MSNKIAYKDENGDLQEVIFDTATTIIVTLDDSEVDWKIKGVDHTQEETEEWIGGRPKRG